MIPEKVLEQTETRFEHHQPSITSILNEVQLGNSRLNLDDPARVIARLERLGANQTQARDILNGEPVSAIKDLDETVRVGIERLLGKNDLISASFLSRGLRAAKAVVRVEIGGGQSRQPAGYGTGFLISNHVLLTNNHVLETLAIASSSQVRFEYEETADGDLNPGVAFALEPEKLFYTDPELDFTVVAVKSNSVKSNSVNGDRSLEEFGWLPLYKSPDRHIKTERVNIIQHPNGEKKQLALRENEIIDRDDDFLRYQTDTTPGSSGSPVFNDAWEVVALHHSGVPKRDANRRVLKRDGSLYQNGEDESLIDWIANEGARASRIVSTLELVSFVGQAEVLIQSVIAATTPPTEETTVNKPSEGRVIPTYPGTTNLTPTERSNFQVHSSGVHTTIPKHHRTDRPP
jgi:endonuclease G, mitochondrial